MIPQRSCLYWSCCKCFFRQRESARIKGEAALAAGEAGAAAQHFSKAVGVTHDMAYQLIKVIDSAITLYHIPGNTRQTPARPSTDHGIASLVE